MKTKVLKYDLAGRSQVFVVSLLALLRKTGLAGEETSGAIPAEVLDTLKIQLVSPNVTGVQVLTTKLTRPCHYSVEGNELTIALGELTPGQHRLTVKSVYGTNTRSLLIIDATVPVGAGETGEAISVDVAAVSTVSDENNADGRVFQSDGEGNATINANTLSIGGGTATGENAVAEGSSTTASGYQSHAEGNSTTASGDQSHAEGDGTTASGDQSHAEGLGTKAIGENSHAEGFAEWGSPYEVTVRPLTAQEKEEIAAKVGNVHPDYICENDEIVDGQAPVLYADEECTEEVARIKWSKYMGNWHDDLSGDFFQIVSGTLAAGAYWARFEPTASGDQSHAEGEGTTASGNQSHAEGLGTTASGNASHAEGNNTTASGYASHAEGNSTTASGDQSHAEGLGTIAASDDQHVSGRYNVVDNEGDYALIVGNGTSGNNRSNAFAIDWDGNLVLFNNGTPVVLTPAKLAQLIA